MKYQALLALSWLFAFAPLRAGEQSKFDLERLPIAATMGAKTEWIMTLRGLAYRNVEELKVGIGKLPKGTEIIWAPSCKLIGGEPLDQKSEMDEIVALCKSLGVTFTIIPSG